MGWEVPQLLASPPASQGLISAWLLLCTGEGCHLLSQEFRGMPTTSHHRAGHSESLEPSRGTTSHCLSAAVAGTRRPPVRIGGCDTPPYMSAVGGHLCVRTEAAKQAICFFLMEQGNVVKQPQEKHKPARKAFFKAP